MPAKSKSQQRFFGMVDAYKKGEMPNASQSIKDAAKGMTSKEVKKFAKTKHKGLPEKIKKKSLKEGYGEELKKIGYGCQTRLEDLLQNPRNGDLKDTARWLSNSFGVDYETAYEDLINVLQGRDNVRRLDERQFKRLVSEMVEEVLKRL